MLYFTHWVIARIPRITFPGESVIYPIVLFSACWGVTQEAHKAVDYPASRSVLRLCITLPWRGKPNACTVVRLYCSDASKYAGKPYLSVDVARWTVKTGANFPIW